jgi:hypothetical protein
MILPNQLVLLLLIMIGLSPGGYGQNFSPAYLISLEGDSITGNIRSVAWTQAPQITSHFEVTTADGEEKTWEAKQIRKYGLKDGRQFYAKKWPHNGMRQFLEPRESGKVQLFVVADPLGFPDRKKNSERLVFDSNFETETDDAYYVSNYNTELIIRVEKDNYEMVLKQILRDCPELTEKIGKKKFRFNRLEQIVATYNESCQ